MVVVVVLIDILVKIVSVLRILPLNNLDYKCKLYPGLFYFLQSDNY